MSSLKIILFCKSPIIRAGVVSLLNKLSISLEIKTISSIDKLGKMITIHNPRFIIYSSSYLTSDNIFVLNKNKNPGIKYIEIADRKNVHSVNIQSDIIITLDNSEEDIINTLERIIPENNGQEKKNAQTGIISDREKTILRNVALGKTNKEISEKLFISPHTVITHRKNITAKLGIKTIAGLTIYATLNKIISPDEVMRL
ncbi:MAG: response regulator transcription factor [Bacteroidales bacterium]|nr:response regulator transcription factor [Bacteroidales bacterium]